MVELVDSLDSGSSAHSGRGGSTPPSRTMKKKPDAKASGFFFNDIRSLWSADDIRFAYEGTDIISCLQSKYIMRREPYIILRQQYFIDPTRKSKNAKKVVDKWDLVWYYLGVVRT